MRGVIGLSGNLNKLSLSTVITAGLAVLIVPVLVFILVFGHHRNSLAIRTILDEQIARTQENSIKTADNLIRPVASTLQVVSQAVAADPTFFKTEGSRELLYQGLISADQIDSFYVTFEDGYHRAVTRINADRRRADPRIPPKARWISSYVVELAAAAERRRHQTFFDAWPNVIDQIDIHIDLDHRNLALYKRTKATRRLTVADPLINYWARYPVMSLGAPVVRNDEYVGIVGANITLNVLSQFLEANRVSKNSLTLIADQNGRIMAHPVPEKGVRKGANGLEFVNLAESDDNRIREAVGQRVEKGQNRFRFTPSSGEELSVSFLDFPPEFGRPWQVVVLTPTDDFVGELKATNRTIVAVIGFLLVLELVLIYLLSRALSRGLENVSRQFLAIQELKFTDSDLRPSKIREIADLQSGFSLLRNALQTFAQYVPLDVVRQLVESDKPLGLGVETRPLTIFFSDLENFSAHAEKLAPADLLRQVSEYFSAVTEAIAQEHGTVDKFIGDAVMAFWGAPLPREDHALRACAGALRAVRRMEKLNEAWARQGRPTIRLRVGLNTATVLVGNVGSAERLSYTVMGDGVNVASRLERINKDFGTTICISDSVFEAVCDRVVARPLGRVKVKGRQTDFMIYELLGLKDADDPELMPRAGDLERAEFAKQAANALTVGERSA
jgi:adenylate cyclase